MLSSHSQVYRGLWKGLMVAVKTITFQDRMVGGDKGQNTAIMEAAISSSMAHPSVVATYYHEVKPMKVEGMDTAIAAGMVTDWKLYIVQVKMWTGSYSFSGRKCGLVAVHCPGGKCGSLLPCHQI